MAVPRFLANIAGRIKMVAAIATSDGAGAAEKIPSTNASGVLDPSLLNAATTGVSKVVMTLGTGLLDPSIMPTGIGADTSSIVASEILAAGDLVNIWNNATVANVRKADATVEGKEVHGFVLSGFAAAATALVYHEGKITGLTGMTPGARQYMATTPGARTDLAPSAVGNVVQMVGIALNATTLGFEVEDPVTVA